MNNSTDKILNQFHIEWKEYGEFRNFLLLQDLDMAVKLDKHFKKIISISAGSYFEHRITEILSDFVKKKASIDEWVAEYLETNQVIDKYFQFFHFGEKDDPECPHKLKDANKLFKFFGKKFKEQINIDTTPMKMDTDDVKLKKSQLKESVEYFLKIGHLRNLFAHSNPEENESFKQKTPQDIYSFFEKSLPFFDYLTKQLQ